MCQYSSLAANYNAPFCFDRIVRLDFSAQGVISALLKQILKKDLAFSFEYSFRNDKCYSVFYSLAFSFLMSIIYVRRYDTAYLSCSNCTKINFFLYNNTYK